jgi:exodeoxyribonuclease-5
MRTLSRKIVHREFIGLKPTRCISVAHEDHLYVTNDFVLTHNTVVLSETARENSDCSLVALSGKAASLLRAKSGMSASTIHAAIYKLVSNRDLQNGKRVMEWRRANKDGLLNGITFLLDEKSMINREIAHDILATGARIVAAGDPGQLPPVRGSQFFAENPNFTLKTVHRQALESPIIRQAHRVRAGLGYQADGDDFRVVDRMPKDDLVNADMVLVWKNATRVELTKITRRYRGLSGQCPQPGEPVMCLKNAADYNVYNGATYTLLKPFEPHDNCITIEMDGEPLSIPNVKFEGMPEAIPAGQHAVTDFTFGYVYTVHKAQGSEADNVVLIDEYAMQEHAIAWRYTAITRAAKRLTVVRW